MKNPDAFDLDKDLEESLNEENLKSILDLVAQVSWWVSPVVYQSIQIVYPKTRRKHSKEERGQMIEGVRLWFNEPASQALWMAVGKTTKEVKNFFVCHIYDGSVYDPKHFTNLANVTAFPKGLQSLSEWKPIADVLKYHSYKLYGYKGPEDKVPAHPKYYPKVWQHVDELDEYDARRMIDKLKSQSVNRPTCRGNDN